VLYQAHYPRYVNPDEADSALKTASCPRVRVFSKMQDWPAQPDSYAECLYPDVAALENEYPKWESSRYGKSAHPELKKLLEYADIIDEVEKLGYKVGEHFGGGGSKQVFHCSHDDHGDRLVVKFSNNGYKHAGEIENAEKLRNHFPKEADRILIRTIHHFTMQIGGDSSMNLWTAEIQPAVTRYEDPDVVNETCCDSPQLNRCEKCPPRNMWDPTTMYMGLLGACESCKARKTCDTCHNEYLDQWSALHDALVHRTERVFGFSHYDDYGKDCHGRDHDQIGVPAGCCSEPTQSKDDETKCIHGHTFRPLKNYAVYVDIDFHPSDVARIPVRRGYPQSNLDD